jgi:hypothetical protein
MIQYSNKNGNSGVVAYQTTIRSITVEFKDGTRYLFTEQSVGPELLERMKFHAWEGFGLNATINREARQGYTRKERL